MALADRKSEDVFNTRTGVSKDSKSIEETDKTRIKTAFDNGDHINDLGMFENLAPALHAIQQLSEDIEELRRYVTAEITSITSAQASAITANTAKTGITSAQATAIVNAFPKSGGTINGNTNVNGTFDVTTTGSPLVRLYQSSTRKGFLQMNTSTNTLRVASEYGSVSLEAAATSGVDSDASYIRIQPGGTVEIGAVDGDATISTDGNMTFRIDADSNETSQKFSFVNNAGTEISSLNESGNLTLTGGIQASLPTRAGATGTLWNDRGLVRVS